MKIFLCWQYPLNIFTVEVKEILILSIYLGEPPNQIERVVTDSTPATDRKPHVNANSHSSV